MSSCDVHAFPSETEDERETVPTVIPFHQQKFMVDTT